MRMNDGADVGARLVRRDVHRSFDRRFALALDSRELEVHDADVFDRHRIVLETRRRDDDGLLALDQHRDVTRAARLRSEITVGRQPPADAQDSLLVVVVASHFKNSAPAYRLKFTIPRGRLYSNRLRELDRINHLDFREA